MIQFICHVLVDSKPDSNDSEKKRTKYSAAYFQN